ncbi:unnamed protein product [Aphanomyces euteiches]
MGDKSAQITKNMVFDGRIDHSLYNQLDNADKVIFYDTLKLCKLLNAFKESIADPRENAENSYKKQYDSMGKANEEKLIDTMDRSRGSASDSEEPATVFQRYGGTIGEYKQRKKLNEKALTFAI